MTERRQPRYRLAQELDNTWAILDASNDDGVLVGGIPHQATACNIVSALNLHWRIILIAAGELAANGAGALDPAIGELVRRARDATKTLGERMVDQVDRHRLEALDRALIPFAKLETGPVPPGAGKDRLEAENKMMQTVLQQIAEADGEQGATDSPDYVAALAGVATAARNALAVLRSKGKRDAGS